MMLIGCLAMVALWCSLCAVYPHAGGLIGMLGATVALIVLARRD